MSREKMGRTPRKASEANIYHVFSRGVGRQLIFEDADDNDYFMRLFKRFANEFEGDVLAWCLMGNHFHLLLKMKLTDLSSFMKRLQVSYALYFNKKYDRPGCLFQGRFGSEPITSDSQLLAAIRYIHHNPQVAGIAPFSAYEWSSYGEYIGNASLCNTHMILGMTDGIEGFIEFHNAAGSQFEFMEDSSHAGRCKKDSPKDAELVKRLRAEHGTDWRTELIHGDKETRNKTLRQLKRSGATVRQISRLTGLGRGIIQRA